MPSGTASGVTATTAPAACPCPASCHIPVQARYGAATTRNHARPDRPRAGAAGKPGAVTRRGRPAPATAATATSQAAAIGRHHAAATYSRRGVHPRHHA